MARPKGSKNKKGPKQFCIHGHDILVYGRNHTGYCTECKRNLGRIKPGIDSRFKQICKRGHDTFICGRDQNGWCILCQEIYAKEYDIENKEIIKDYMQVYREAHKDIAEKYAKQYRIEHREELNNKAVQRRKENINTRLKTYLRARLVKALRGNFKSGSTVKDLGCSISFFKEYIESLFYGDMRWDNWGKVWELDHIEELCTFDLTNRDQFLIACNYTNFQPLTIEDHRKKTNAEIKRRSKLKFEYNREVEYESIRESATENKE